MQWVRKQAWFIYLFAAWAYLVGVKDYAFFTNVSQLFIRVIIFTTVVLLVHFVLRKMNSKKERISIILFWSLMAFTFFGNIKDTLFKVAPFLASYKVLPFLIVIAIGLLFYALKNNRKATNNFYFCNILIMVLLAYQLGQFVYDRATQSNRIIHSASIEAFKEKPTIYLVLFDGYPGFETLDTLFNYNNTKHKEALIKRGFHVSDNIRSNYNYTLAAMSSLFNMNYVRKEHSLPIDDFSFLYKSRETINNSSVAQAFQREDYDIHNLSIFPFAGQKGYGDYIGYMTPLELAERNFFHNYLLNSLAQSKKSKHLPIIKNFEKRLDRYYYQNERIVTDLLKVKNNDKPSFTYAHLLLPHEPYLTDSSGVLWKDLSAIPEKEAFRQYTLYANKLMLKIADSLSVRDPNAILLFLSDHGFRGLTGEDKKYSFHNFMAIKTPDTTYTNIDKVKSNINVFPHLLNEYCGQSIPYQNDSTFFIFYTKNIFETITERP
jgi:hypothetical protein